MPIEPTREMWDAESKVDNDAYAGGNHHGASSEQIWHAMLGAAPTPPANALSAGDRVDMNDWNTQMVAVQALLNCTSGELECVGEKLLEGYIADVKRVYAAILQSKNK